ncbi:MAG: hypothetical protein H6553_05625 [Chitinophagales bacterium]|nr:hypothetical protein [Chitinophagales bacterium]
MKTILKTSFFLVVLLITTTIVAQTPQSFSYQTVIRDNTGNPLANQSISLKISILKGESNGTTVYSETHNKTTNAFGLVNLNIGDGSVVSGNFANINWGNDIYFVKTELDATGGNNFTVMGVQQLLSVPYALHAKTVAIDNVNDADANPTNELQDLSFNNSTGVLSISNGNSVTLPTTSGGDNWGTQTVQHNTTLSGNGTTASPLQVVGDLTDDQTLSLSGNNLSISGGNSVNLNSIDNQILTLSGDNLTISNGNTANLSSIDNQTLSYNSVSGQLSIVNGNSVTIPSSADNWGSQTVQHNTTLSGNGTTASPLQVVGDLTDDQTLALSGNTLSISDGNNVDMSGISSFIYRQINLDPSYPELDDVNQIVYLNGTTSTVALPSDPTIGRIVYLTSSASATKISSNGKALRKDGTTYLGDTIITMQNLANGTGIIGLIYTGNQWMLFSNESNAGLKTKVQGKVDATGFAGAFYVSKPVVGTKVSTGTYRLSIDSENMNIYNCMVTTKTEGTIASVSNSADYITIYIYDIFTNLKVDSEFNFILY